MKRVISFLLFFYLPLNATEPATDLSEPFGHTITFGAVETHELVGHCFTFVSTYNLSVPHTFCVAANLKTLTDGTECYVVFQNPPWEQFPDKYSPYTLRPHAAIHNSKLYALDDKTEIVVRLTHTDNIRKDGTHFHVELNQESNIDKNYIRTHRRDNGELTFCPNNMWLSGQPERLLQDDDYFSFGSHVEGLDKKIKTFHFLAGDIAPLYEIARTSHTFDEYMVHLLSSDLSKNPAVRFHIDKLRRFLTEVM